MFVDDLFNDNVNFENVRLKIVFGVVKVVATVDDIVSIVECFMKWWSRKVCILHNNFYFLKKN